MKNSEDSIQFRAGHSESKVAIVPNTRVFHIFYQRLEVWAINVGPYALSGGL